MREKLNENPIVQVALIAVLALVVGYLALSHLSGGGGEAAESEGAAPASSVTDGTAGAPGVAPTSVVAPPGGKLPAAVESAYAGGRAVVLLVVREGGIDDRLVKRAAGALRDDSQVALFVVPAKRIASYAAITGPLGVEGAPALIVVRPRRLNGSGPAAASVAYGFQTTGDIRQAVRDALYQGPSLSYAPN